MRQGTCGFVLSPRYNNIKYVDFNFGCVFGVVDILGSLLNFEDGMDLEYCFSNWIVYKDRLKRQFTVATQSHCELLTLSIQDLWNMKTEFIEAYESLMANSYDRLDRCHRLKLQAIKYCEKHMFKHDKKHGHNHEEHGLKKGATLQHILDKHGDSFHFMAVDLREVDNPDMPLGGSSFEVSDSDDSASYATEKGEGSNVSMDKSIAEFDDDKKSAGRLSHISEVDSDYQSD